jgi:hypothetical protein
MKSIKLFPTKEENKVLSPYLMLENLKKSLSSEEWMQISKKIMLIHSKNDRIIKFKNLKDNKLVLKTPQENLLILKKGGHSQKKNESALVGATLNFLTS